MIRLCAFSDEAGSSLEEQIAALKRNNISLMELRSIDSISNWGTGENATYKETTITAHRNKVMIAFCDGRAEAVDYMKIPNGPNARVPNGKKPSQHIFFIPAYNLDAGYPLRYFD